MNACAIIMLCFMCLVPLTTSGDVYKFIGRNGQVIYTDSARHSGYKMVIKSREPLVDPVTISLGLGKRKDFNAINNKITSTSGELIKEEAINYKEKIKKEVPLRRVGGVYEIPVLVNDIKKKYFVIDSGAADVSIPLPDWIAMISDGTITGFDELQPSEYQNASGDVNVKLRYILPKMRVGSKLIKNIVCSIGEDRSDMLLGQSALEKLGKHFINYKKGVFVLE